MNLLPETPVVGIGLMSGTSADGIDAAAARLWREEGRTRVELLARYSLPYPTDVRDALLDAFNNHARTFDLCCLNARLGDLFADAAEQLAAKLDGAGPLAFVASHGQTVWHYPPGGQVHPVHEPRRRRDESKPIRVPSTLQLGEGTRIAERLRVPVVCDFRQQDMAAGGQGAPLTPYLDYLLLSHPTENRAVQNLGGIGNVAYLPAGGGPEDVIAFDTGPGNALIDGAATSTSMGSQQYDVDGRMAATAPVEDRWLAWLMYQFDDVLAQPPPKSTGRELFSLKWVDDLWELKCRGKRLVSTLTQFTVETVADQYGRWLGPIDLVILTGGGARNPELVKRLRARLSPARVVTLDEIGIDSAAREALAFAVMGYETLCGRTSTLPATTGASRAVIQGKIVLA